MANYYEKERINLGENVPLANPLAIHIEVTDVCNFHCKFCPHDLLGKSSHFSHMNSSLFRKIIDDIENMPVYIPKVNFNGLGEPLLHPEIIDMLKYAYKLKTYSANSSGIGKFEMITNGSPFIISSNRNLFECVNYLDTLIISIEGLTAEKYISMCEYKMDIEKLLKALKKLYELKGNCKIIIKTIDVAIESVEDKRLFYDLFSPFADIVNIEYLSNIWPQFTVPNLSGSSSKNRFGYESDNTVRASVCPQIFKTLFIKKDGTCSPCCYDWMSKIIIGNISTNSIKDIWRGEGLKRLQISFLEDKQSEIVPCKNCIAYKVCDIDNIDRYKAAILNKLKG